MSDDPLVAMGAPLLPVERPRDVPTGDHLPLLAQGAGFHRDRGAEIAIARRPAHDEAGPAAQAFDAHTADTATRAADLGRRMDIAYGGVEAAALVAAAGGAAYLFYAAYAGIARQVAPQSVPAVQAAALRTDGQMQLAMRKIAEAFDRLKKHRSGGAARLGGGATPENIVRLHLDAVRGTLEAAQRVAKEARGTLEVSHVRIRDTIVATRSRYPHNVGDYTVRYTGDWNRHPFLSPADREAMVAARNGLREQAELVGHAGERLGVARGQIDDTLAVTRGEEAARFRQLRFEAEGLAGERERLNERLRVLAQRYDGREGSPG
ncbi:hypothetical protein ACIBQ1_37605 [Nonomuraea sp. NPDC050153]|uniref:hypothetical protein n=1 Tax=Nonomuraea sp. NPDC050153 TaxID=3364359 RepID=UPI003794D569